MTKYQNGVFSSQRNDIRFAIPATLEGRNPFGGIGYTGFGSSKKYSCVTGQRQLRSLHQVKSRERLTSGVIKLIPTFKANLKICITVILELPFPTSQSPGSVANKYRASPIDL